MTEDPTPRPSITVKGEWMLIGVSSAIAAAFHLWEILEFPEAYVEGKRTLPGVLMGLTVWLGQGVWMSMDRRRRGREMGAWRFAVLFLGPLAIWYYLLIEYRGKAIYLVPLSLIPYLFVIFLPAPVAYLVEFMRGG